MTKDIPTALIAEDEPLLAAQLQHELREAWPELLVAAVAGDGRTALREALAHRPSVCFLDIRMPGLTGLEVAEALAEDWPEDAGAPPLVVFVTAYDQHALDAFERAAVDYVLKPVQPVRLARTVALLRQRLDERRGAAAGAPNDLSSLARLLAGAVGGSAPRPAPLRVVQAASGNTVHVVPIDEVLLFEAADKYVRVITASRELLIRTALRELLPQLDESVFWQVHRGTVVRCDAIERAVRDDGGRLTLHLRGTAERPVVSRLHAHRFRGM